MDYIDVISHLFYIIELIYIDKKMVILRLKFQEEWLMCKFIIKN